VGQLQIEAAEDPEYASTVALAKEYGLECTQASDVLVREDPDKLKKIDEQIASQKIESGWIVEGQAFKGEAVDAANAYSAAKAFGGDSSVWVVVPGDQPMAIELVRTETPAKNTVWVATNWITPCPPE
jgi:hypothetical protein